MKSILTYAPILTLLILTIGCSTENPLCTTSYCVEGELFLKSELDDAASFDDLPASVTEETLVNLLTVDVGEYTFEPVEISGRIDWEFDDTAWEYTENNISYLKKVVLEIEADDGEFGSNRILLIHLNNDTVSTDANFINHVDFLGIETVELTHHTGIGTFKGNIVGAPTK